VLASLVERRSGIATAPQKGKPLCVGFSITLRDVLLIHDRKPLKKRNIRTHQYRLELALANS
jgi:hypothetical protein